MRMQRAVDRARWRRARRPGVESLERRAVPAKFTFLTPGGIGMSVGGFESHNLTLNDRGSVVVQPGGNIGAGVLLVDSYPLGTTRYVPSADDEFVLTAIPQTPSPVSYGTVQSGTDYGAPLLVRVDPSRADEADGDPVDVHFSADAGTSATITYRVGTGPAMALAAGSEPGFAVASLGIGDVFELSISDQLPGTFARVLNFYMDVFPTISRPDLRPTSVSWAGDGGVDFQYLVDSNAFRDTTVGLYWADGPGISDAIGAPIASFPVAKSAGTYSRHVSPTQFGSPPANASNLLVVIDKPDAGHANGIVREFDETNNALELDAELTMESVKWRPDVESEWQNNPDAGGVTVSYRETGAVLAKGKPIRLAWASGTTPETVIKDGPVIGHGEKNQSLVVADKDGASSTHVPAAQLGTPPEGAKYLLAILDPPDDAHPRGSLREANEGDNVGYPDTSEKGLLGNSVHYEVAGPTIFARFLPAEGDDPPDPDQPGRGALLLDQARVLLGLASFNWVQSLTLPAGWRPYQVDLERRDYDLMPDHSSAVPGVNVLDGKDDVLPYTIDESGQLVLDTAHPISKKNLPDPGHIADPMVQDGTYAADGTLSFLVFFNAANQFGYVDLPNTVLGPLFDPPDSLPYFYNLGFDVGRWTRPYELTFHDTPSIGNGLGSVRTHFTTFLAGVKDDHTPTAWSGLKTILGWDSNAVSVSNVSYLRVDDPAVVPPIASGGILGVTVDPGATLPPVPGDPPVVGAIGDVSVTEGGTVTVGITAADPDPARTLTYSLDPGAPADATIESKTGVFRWTPAAGFAAAKVTVRVTDDASPPRSSVRSFTVSVADVPPHAFMAQATLTPDGHFLGIGGFTDPGGGAETWAAVIDYHDGAGPQPLALAADRTFHIDHAFPPGPGHSSATITVTDSGGLSGVLNLNLTVEGSGGGPPGGPGPSQGPPGVTSVRLVAIGRSDDLVLTFDRPMDPSAVIDPGNYLLQLPGQGPRRKPRALRLVPTSYDAATHTATFLVTGRLTVGQKLKGTIRSGGGHPIKDAAGAALGADMHFSLRVPRPPKPHRPAKKAR